MAPSTSLCPSRQVRQSATRTTSGSLCTGRKSTGTVLTSKKDNDRSETTIPTDNAKSFSNSDADLNSITGFKVDAAF